MLKFSSSLIWRLGTRSSIRNYSTPGATVLQNEKLDITRNVAAKSPKTSTESNDTSGLVAAAFASLNTPEEELKKPSPKSSKLSKIQIIDAQISKASDVNSLLVVAESAVVSRRHALKMVSILSEWSSSSKVKLTDFEKDPRFLKLCRILARTPSSQAISSLTMAEDLSTVLGITGDDEAARLITNLTLQQMIKASTKLITSYKGKISRVGNEGPAPKRSSQHSLLRALSHNITKQPEVIDLKKSADLLFSMAALNFPDPVLLDRICNDVIECLPANVDKPAVVNSILISLGLLKYRHEPVLSAITSWLQRNKSVCRAGDIASAVVTLATVNCVPAGAEELFQAAVSLKEEELTKPSAWLDLVFSLAVLERAPPEHLASVLRADFIEKLLSGEIPIPVRRKLMMLDAYASLTGAPGSLPADVAVGVPVIHAREKQLYVQSIMDTFSSLVSAEAFLRRDCNSNMGFLYDAELALDSKCNPVPLEKAAKDNSVHRIAVMGLDYHDMSRKSPAPLGSCRLCTRLLQLKGYKVLLIPYTEYNPKDKLVTRVQYIEKRLKEIVSEASS